MARDIKFKAYTKEYGVKKVTELVWGLNQNPKVVGFENGISVSTAYGIGKDVIVEQYTGLVDMNGTEIYEGDIVRMHVIVLSPDDKIGVVKYSPQYGYSIYFTSGRMARQEYWATGDKHTIEVIGNIHENPELLEEK